MIHTWATTTDDQTVEPRWGKVGMQKIEDAGSLCPERMKTVDDEILDHAFKFAGKATSQGKPFFLWLNPTRMHVVTYLSDKYEKMRTPENGWSEEEAGMAQLDDIVGSVLRYLKDQGLDDNTIVAFSTDNGAENFTWPDGGQTPFAGAKGTVMEGGFRAPAMIRWPGHVPAGKIENGIMSGLDWFPTFVAAAGDPNVVEELKQGKEFCPQKLRKGTESCSPKYKVHLDGYNQMDLITGNGPSKRHEIFTSQRLRSARCASTTTNIDLSTSPTGGLAGRSRWIGRSSSTSASILSSVPACPDPLPITIGLLTSFGVSSSCSRRWRNTLRRSSST